MSDDERARALVVADQLARRESEREEFTNRILAYGREERRRVWEGLKLTNEQLAWVLRELGPTGTQAEAYIKATVQYVMAVRQQAREEEI